MAIIKELIREESNGLLSFGDYSLETKAKKSDFEYCGDLYKVKTFKEITKLEKNGLFVYESVPGTAVSDFEITDREVSFVVEGYTDSQITLELEAEKEYIIYIDDANAGKMRTNAGGKLMLSVELSPNEASKLKVVRL